MSDNKSFTGFQVKSAIFNAVCELTDEGLTLTVEDVRKLGKATEIITGQRWYGFITRALRGEVWDNWKRLRPGYRLGLGIAGMYRKMIADETAAAQ
jgi:hypothetical protein